MELVHLVLVTTIALLISIIGIKVLLTDAKSVVNRSFALLSIIIATWISLDFMLYQKGLAVFQTFLNRLDLSAICMMVVALSYFVTLFPKELFRLSKLLIYVIFIITTVLISIIMFTDKIISYAFIEDYGSNFNTGSLFFIFAIFASIAAIYSVVVLVIKYRKYSGIEKQQVKYILYGIAFLTFFNLTFNLFIPIFTKSFIYGRFGSYSAIFLVGFIAYAILKAHLFDIRVIIRKVFLYTSLLSIVFGTYTAFAFLLTSFLPLNQTISSFLAAAVIAFGFEPLRNKLQSITEKYLFVADYNADQELKHLTETLSSVVDLDEALRQVIQHLARAMKLSRAAALVLVRDSKDAVTVRRIQEVAFPGAQRLMTEEYLPIVTLFLHEPRIRLVDLMQQEVDEQAVDDKTIKQRVNNDAHRDLVQGVSDKVLKKQALALLKKAKVAVVVPIMVKQKLIGLLYLGEKLSNANFFEDDLNFITIVGSQTGSAIEKARFYEEDQLKSEFVSIASHELLTPTTAIEGYLSMILDENMAKVDPKAREYLQKVYTSSKRLSALVKDLLSVSRIEAGRMKIEPKMFDLGEVVQQQVDQLVFKAKEAGLTLNYIRPKKEAMVFADPDRTAQAVVNLVGNSIKYTKQGSVTIELLDRPRHIEVTVTDTGIGIKPEDREHLFEKFQRINSADTTGIIGSGLGLYITKSIIELMNGVVTVKSTYGKGSTFAFTLPKKPQKS